MMLPDRLSRCKSAMLTHKQDDCSNFRPISLTLGMYLEKVPTEVHFQRGAEVLVYMTAKNYFSSQTYLRKCYRYINP